MTSETGRCEFCGEDAADLEPMQADPDERWCGQCRRAWQGHGPRAGRGMTRVEPRGGSRADGPLLPNTLSQEQLERLWQEEAGGLDDTERQMIKRSLDAEPGADPGDLAHHFKSVAGDLMAVAQRLERRAP